MAAAMELVKLFNEAVDMMGRLLKEAFASAYGQLRKNAAWPRRMVVNALGVFEE
jgi:hypothetical protein